MNAISSASIRSSVLLTSETKKKLRKSRVFYSRVTSKSSVPGTPWGGWEGKNEVVLRVEVLRSSRPGRFTSYSSKVQTKVEKGRDDGLLTFS